MAKIREFEEEQISLTQKFSQKGKQFENISNKTNYLEHQLSQEERENKYLKDKLVLHKKRTNDWYLKKENIQQQNEIATLKGI